MESFDTLPHKAYILNILSISTFLTSYKVCVCKVNFNISKLKGFVSKAVIPTFEAFNNNTTGTLPET